MQSQTEAVDAYKVVRRIQADPLHFVRRYIGDRLWEQQKLILESVRDNADTTVKSGHGTGKTFTAARVALWFFIAHPDSIVLSTAPTYNQVKNQLWRELRGAMTRSEFVIDKKTQTQLEADDEWYALGLSTRDEENFQGFHTDYILAIVDEASGVSEDIFGAVDSVLTSSHAKRLYIGNPTARAGEFYRSHNDSDYSRIHIPVFDTPNFTEYGVTEQDILSRDWRDKITGPMPYPELVTPKWAYKYAKKHPPGTPGYAVKILGEFPESSTDTFISQKLCKSAQDANLEAEGRKELGVDPARFGDDETGYCIRQGPVVKKIWSKPHTNEMEVAGEVVATVREEDIGAVKIDTIGPGAGAYDRVQEVKNEQALFKAELIEVKGSQKAKDKEVYYNKASELWGAIKERMQDGELDIPPDEDLFSQFTTRKYKYNSRGQIRLESKEDMKGRGLPSPDRADSVCYAFYIPEEGERAQAHDMYG